MKKVNWVEILEKNEEAILEAGRQAYKNACMTNYDNSFSMTEDVIVYSDNEISTLTQQRNWETIAQRKGEAICPISIERFYVWENIEEDKYIEDTLGVHFREFKQWLGNNKIERYGKNELRKWNSKIADEIDNELIEWDIDEHMEEQVQSQFDRYIEKLKEEEIIYKEMETPFYDSELMKRIKSDK